jgi:hypothetical protein
MYGIDLTIGSVEEETTIGSTAGRMTLKLSNVSVSGGTTKGNIIGSMVFSIIRNRR